MESLPKKASFMTITTKMNNARARQPAVSGSLSGSRGTPRGGATRQQHFGNNIGRARSQRSIISSNAGSSAIAATVSFGREAGQQQNGSTHCQQPIAMAANSAGSIQPVALAAVSAGSQKMAALAALSAGSQQPVARLADNGPNCHAAARGGGQQGHRRTAGAKRVVAAVPPSNRPPIRRAPIGAKRLITAERLLTVGCWNVNTLSDNKPGREDILADDLVKHRVDIIGLSEVRKPGTGAKTIRSSCDTAYTLHYSGHAKNRVNGVGLALSQYARKALIYVNTISDRLMVARFRQGAEFVSVVVCYAPTEDTGAAAKNVFYSALNNAVAAISKKDFVFVVGDLNAGVGAQRAGWERFLGPNTASGARNDNGTRLLQFCAEHNLRLSNTFFAKKRSHLVTWSSNAGNCEKTLDYILVRGRHFSWTQDVRVFQQTALPTDHHLLLATVKLKLSTVKQPPRKRKFDVKRLRDQATALDYRTRVSELLVASGPSEGASADEMWTKMKDAIAKAGQDTIGYAKSKKTDRFASATTNALIVQLHRTSSKRDRKRLGQQIRRSSRKDEESYWSSAAVKLQQAFDNGDSKTLFRLMREMGGGGAAVTETVYASDGTLLHDKDACLRRWKSYFDELLNKSAPAVKDHVLIAEAAAAVPDVRISTAPPTEDEVRKVIGGLKDGKAAGLDLIPPEFFKTACDEIVPYFTSLLNKIWETSDAPEELQECALGPVFKKGDRKECSNHRGIAVLPIACKVLGIIILGRLVRVLDEKTAETQAGFRPGRGTIEQILFLRQVLERRCEHKKETVMAFLDFSAAFDSVDRSMLWDLLRVAGVPRLYVDLIRSMYEKTKCRIKAYGRLSDAFQVRTGVRQGDVLSPLLFLRAIDYVIQKAAAPNDGVLLGEGIKAATAEYADDVALIGESVQQLQAHIDGFQAAAEFVGLSLNERKCKSIAFPPTPMTTSPSTTSPWTLSRPSATLVVK
jgi:hypothetical protein